MRIAVCDDDPAFLKQLGEKVRDIAFISQVEQYSEMDLFFADLEDGRIFDLVLMDLDWGEHATGIEYAEKLYGMVPHLPVIYVTGFNDRFSQQILLKKTNLAGYLTKPIDEMLFVRYLKKVIDNRDSAQTLSFQQQGRLLSVEMNRIVYLESKNHICVIHTDARPYSVYEKLSTLSGRLGSSFVQCHKSYIVNMRWIRRVEAGRIFLKSGEMLPVSRACGAAAKEKVLRFMGLQV